MIKIKRTIVTWLRVGAGRVRREKWGTTSSRTSRAAIKGTCG